MEKKNVPASVLFFSGMYFDLPSIIRKGLSKYSFMVWATLTILCLWAPLQKSEWFIRETANLEI